MKSIGIYVTRKLHDRLIDINRWAVFVKAVQYSFSKGYDCLYYSLPERSHSVALTSIFTSFNFDDSLEGFSYWTTIAKELNEDYSDKGMLTDDEMPIILSGSSADRKDNIFVDLMEYDDDGNYIARRIDEPSPEPVFSYDDIRPFSAPGTFMGAKWIDYPDTVSWNIRVSEGLGVYVRSPQSEVRRKLLLLLK